MLSLRTDIPEKRRDVRRKGKGRPKRNKDASNVQLSRPTVFDVRA